MMKTKQILKATALLILLTFTSCEDKVPDGVFAEIQTNKGMMLVKLNYKATPLTVANFITLAEGTNSKVSDSLKGKKYYEGVIFHRVIKDFMIQGGDRTGTGMGGPGYRFKDEFVDSLRHDKKGTLSMANSGPATNGSQFFITLKETPHLDGRHTIFGQLVEGESVLDSIGSTLTSKDPATKDRPIDDIVIQQVNILKGGEGKKFNAKKYFSEFFKKEEKLKKETIATFESQKQQAEAFESGIKVLTLEEGTGKKPNQGDNIELNYSGFLADSGNLFASSWYEVAKKYGIASEQANAQGAYKPMPSQYSSEVGLIAGFREAMLTMSIGQKVRVFIPSKLGYGERGSGPIPPNSDLVFDIELIGVTDK